MSVFKAALKLVFRYPAYLLVYIVLFGLLGLVVTGVSSGSATGEVRFEPAERSLAIIDRDGSEVSRGIADYLGRRATIVELADEPRVLQDAIAQDDPSYILIIEPGYGDKFMSAARAGRPLPELTSVVSVAQVSGVLLDTEVENLLRALAFGAYANPDASDAELLRQAAQAAELQTPIAVVQQAEQINRASLFPFYYTWSTFPLLSGIAVLVGLLFSNFSGGELRRRNLSSPVPSLAMNGQIALASLAFVLMAWAFIFALSMTPPIGGLELLTSNPAAVGLITGAAFVYCLLALAVGFLVSQFSLGEVALNGFVTIISMVLMFLSGIMMGGVGYLDGIMLTIGRLTPTFWYSIAIDAVVEASDLSWQSLQPYLTSLGIVALYALAIFSIALLVGRLRMQTTDAGGNTAADLA